VSCLYARLKHRNRTFMKKSTPNYLVLRLKINNHNNPSFIAKSLDNEDFHPLKILFNLFSCISNIIQSCLASLNYKFKSILKQNIQTISYLYNIARFGQNRETHPFGISPIIIIIIIFTHTIYVIILV